MHSEGAVGKMYYVHTEETQKGGMIQMYRYAEDQREVIDNAPEQGAARTYSVPH